MCCYHDACLCVCVCAEWWATSVCWSAEERESFIRTRRCLHLSSLRHTTSHCTYILYAHYGAHCRHTTSHLTLNVDTTYYQSINWYKSIINLAQRHKKFLMRSSVLLILSKQKSFKMAFTGPSRGGKFSRAPRRLGGPAVAQKYWMT